MKANEIRDYLENNIKITMDYEILPAIRLGESEGGYFAVPLIVFAYCDLLGCLYTGNRKGRNGKPLTSRNAVQFIRDCFRTADRNYKRFGGLLYHIYRHGIAHTYEPKKVKLRNGRQLLWVIGKTGMGQRTFVWDVTNIQYTHLERSGDHFAISITCLYEDLKKAIDDYISKLDSSQGLRDKFNSAKKEIDEPESEESIRHRKYICDSDFSF